MSINVCPKCGEVVDSSLKICPLCNFDLSHTIKSLSNHLKDVIDELLKNKMNDFNECDRGNELIDAVKDDWGKNQSDYIPPMIALFAKEKCKKEYYITEWRKFYSSDVKNIDVDLLQLDAIHSDQMEIINKWDACKSYRSIAKYADMEYIMNSIWSYAFHVPISFLKCMVINELIIEFLELINRDISLKDNDVDKCLELLSRFNIDDDYGDDFSMELSKT